MRKFKKGDKVKLISLNHDDYHRSGPGLNESMKKKLGRTFTFNSYGEAPSKRVFVEECSYTYLEESFILESIGINYEIY
jgi:hypothetical protein